MKKKQWLFLISLGIALVLALSLHLISAKLKKDLPHENAAILWDDSGDTAHISVFFAESEKHELKADLESTSYMLKNWYHNLQTKLTEASIETAHVTNANARKLVYGYHATGKVSLQNNKKKVEVSAYGVGGDFFQFHPVKLLQGSYFSESDLMQDHIIIDTETAWQLFGSNDVVGMFVTIKDIPHMVVGVYERERGYLLDAAGNEVSRVFVSHSSLQKYGAYHGLEGVEYFIPNPVTGFGKGLIEAECQDKEVTLIEHQNRFTFLPLLKVIGQIGTRSMVLSDTTFPYWENMARAYEDILAGILLIVLVLWLYVTVVTIGFVWHFWMKRRWRAKHIYEKIKDYHYAFSVKRHAQKQAKNGRGEGL